MAGDFFFFHVDSTLTACLDFYFAINVLVVSSWIIVIFGFFIGFAHGFFPWIVLLLTLTSWIFPLDVMLDSMSNSPLNSQFGGVSPNVDFSLWTLADSSDNL